MDALEKISEQKKCMFVDLFVRVSNTVAITMYKASKIIKNKSISELFNILVSRINLHSK